MFTFCHANSFPAECYRQFFDALPGDVNFISRFGHGEMKLNRSVLDLVPELVRHIQDLPEPTILIGHSLGGILALHASHLVAENISGLFLIEPPLFRPVKRYFIGISQALGLAEYLVPPARAAKRRKWQFESREHAFVHFRSKRLFQGFSDTSLMDYVTYGLEADGEKLRLRFDRDIETRIFTQLPTLIRPHWKNISGYLIYGENSQIYRTKDVHWWSGSFPKIPAIKGEGGHLLPLERPVETASLIQNLL